jgi:FAD:protein FMN transferase
MKIIGSLRTVFFVYSIGALFTACAPQAPREASRTGTLLGTACVVRLVGGGSERLLDAVFARLAEIEGEISVKKDGTQIQAVNEAAGLHPVPVGLDAIAIIKRDLDLASWSDGAFDPSVGPLAKLWGIGSLRDETRPADPPGPSEIAAARRLVGWKDIVLDEARGTVFLKRKGMALDLGSTTKGFAADEIAKLIRAAGVKKAVIDLGGNVLVVGSRPDGKPWRIGLQNPFWEKRGDYLGIASLTDKTMVTSGVYERYFEDRKTGKRYHHILDTRTGYPVDNGLMSVTVISPKSFDADGFTTMIFALGREKGMELAKAKGVDAIIVDSSKKLYLSPGVSTYFEITDPSFSFAE